MGLRVSERICRMVLEGNAPTTVAVMRSCVVPSSQLFKCGQSFQLGNSLLTDVMGLKFCPTLPGLML